MKYVLYGHDGSANHGCEALVRSTAELLDYKKNKIYLSSAKPDEDRKYRLDEICRITQRGQKVTALRKDADYWRSYYALKVKHRFFPMDALYETQAIGAGKGSVALSIGGDSYCYSDTMRQRLFHQHEVFRSQGMKTVLWGCSFEKELLQDQKTAEDIRSFDLITARETISYEALRAYNPNTILVADSAFLLPEKRLPLPEGFEEQDFVGINLSPLVQRRENEGGIVMNNYLNLVQSILQESNYRVLLIPHVVWKTNDDREPLRDIFDRFKNTGRIAMVEDHNCYELKGYISRCRFFIGARTHATIAAYSTGVPTLALGYSTKAKGIARDLFGTDENYVVPVQELKSETAMRGKWHWLQNNETVIRLALQKVMPEYRKRVLKGLEAVRKL